MTNKYRFKNKALEQALNVIYGEEYVEDQVNRQMTNTTSYICFESDNSSTTISKGEIDHIREYDPCAWNPFPKVNPPKEGYYIVYLKESDDLRIQVDRFVKQDSFCGWRNNFKCDVLAFRPLNVEPPRPEELNG